jgi:hypothetical protein
MNENYVFTTPFRKSVKRVAKAFGLKNATTKRMKNNKTLRFFDKKKNVYYSLHQSGYVRRHIIVGYSGEYAGYQLNDTVVTPELNRKGNRSGRMTTERILANPTEQLGIFSKAVANYRSN